MRAMAYYQNKPSIKILNKEDFVLCCSQIQKVANSRFDKILHEPIHTTDENVLGKVFDFLYDYKDIMYLCDYSTLLEKIPPINVDYGLTKILNNKRRKCIELSKYKHRSFIFLDGVVVVNNNIFLTYYTIPPTFLTTKLNNMIRGLLLDDIIDSL